MKSSKVSETIQQYLKTTTLHGFKYLCSIHCADRIGWLVCCCASACCAGVLCAVLWARFLQVPALLTVSDDVRMHIRVEDQVPTVAICLPSESVADMFLEKLSKNSTQTKRIPMTLANLLNGKSTSREQLVLLDQLLSSNNVTLPQVMMDSTPDCKEYTKRCRYQKKMLPCDELFDKEITAWGLCCVMRPKKLSNVRTGLMGRALTTQMIDLVVQCSHGSTLYGCQMVTSYSGEEWIEPQDLMAGYYYMAQLRFIAIPESQNSNLVENHCISDKSYSRAICLRRCAEHACGCSDPLQFKYYGTHTNLPACPATRLSCLRAHEYKRYGNVSCECKPACKTITTFVALEPSPMNLIKQAIDPIFNGLNSTPTIVVSLKVNVQHSRVFLLNTTETWLTLLSSLGGVFNMFLGVGLFSALELLYLILVKLPVAMRKSSEIHPTASGAIR